MEQRLTGNSALADAGIDANDGFEDAPVEVLLEAVEHFSRDGVALVVHNGQNAVLEMGVGALVNGFDGLHQAHNAPGSQVIGLDGNDHLIGGGEGHNGEGSERGRTIQKDEIVARREGLEMAFEQVFVAALLGEVMFHHRQARVAEYNIETGQAGGMNKIGGGKLAGGWRRVEQVGDGFIVEVGCLAERDAETGLRVEIDEQNASAFLDKRSANGSAGRRFTDAAFLIGNGNCLSHKVCW